MSDLPDLYAGERLLCGTWHPYDERPDTWAPHDVRTEVFWLPIIGPTALCALRYLGALVDRNPRGGSVRMSIMAQRLGVGHHVGRPSPLTRALGRLVRYRLALEGDTRYWVTFLVPPPPPPLWRKLDPQLRANLACYTVDADGARN